VGMRKLFVLLLCLGLSGCVTQMQNGLNALQGKPAQTAFDVLGYPSSKQVFGNDTVYYWQVDRTGGVLMPQTSTTSGFVGTAPVYGTTTYNQVVPVHANCEIKVITDSKGTIINWEYGGNLMGCAEYVDRLNKYASQSKAAEKQDAFTAYVAARMKENHLSYGRADAWNAKKGFWFKDSSGGKRYFKTQKELDKILAEMGAK